MLLLIDVWLTAKRSNQNSGGCARVGYGFMGPAITGTQQPTQTGSRVATFIHTVLEKGIF